MNTPKQTQMGGLPLFESLEARLLLSGTVYVVDSLLDNVATDTVVTLREAIEAANTNTAVTGDVLAGSGTETDVITFAPALTGGTIVLDGTELSITGDLNIQGLGEDVLTVNAGWQSRAFYIEGVETEVELAGLKIIGGYAFYIDAIEDGYGGGIYNDSGALTLTDSTMSGNMAQYDGGGIYNNGGTLTLTGTTVSGNFSGNNGAGIYSHLGATTLTNSVVSGNFTGASGGGLYLYGSTTTLMNSEVSGNSATEGAGIYSYGDTLVLTNSTVSGNFADYLGGGIYHRGGTLILANSTVSGNSANTGGGIYNGDSWIPDDDVTLTLDNTIVALNNAPANADIYGSIIAHSILVGGDPGFVRNPSAGPDGVWGTADDDCGDLRLLPTSPAIDAGDNALAVDTYGVPLTTDLAGKTRIIGAAVDIGAFEYTLPGDANGDGSVDLQDFGLVKANFGMTTGATWAQGDFNADGAVDLQDFGLLKANFGSVLQAAIEVNADVGEMVEAPMTPGVVDGDDIPTTPFDFAQGKQWPGVEDGVGVNVWTGVGPDAVDILARGSGRATGTMGSTARLVLHLRSANVGGQGGLTAKRTILDDDLLDVFSLSLLNI